MADDIAPKGEHPGTTADRRRVLGKSDRDSRRASAEETERRWKANRGYGNSRQELMDRGKGEWNRAVNRNATTMPEPPPNATRTSSVIDRRSPGAPRTPTASATPPSPRVPPIPDIPEGATRTSSVIDARPPGATRAGMPPLNMPSRLPAGGRGFIPELAAALNTGRQLLHDTYIEPAKRRGREMIDNQIRSQGADRDTSDYGPGRGTPEQNPTRRPKATDTSRLEMARDESLPLPPPAATPPRRAETVRRPAPRHAPAPERMSEADVLNQKQLDEARHWRAADESEIDRLMRERVATNEGMMKKGGLVKMAKGGQVKGFKPKAVFKPKMVGGGAVRGCGIAQRGKTRGRVV